MIRLLALPLAAASLCLLHAETVNFRDVSLAERRDNGKPRLVKGQVSVDTNTGVFTFTSKRSNLTVPLKSTTSLVYDRNDRFPFLPAPPFPFFIPLNGNRQLNYVTLQYNNAQGKAQYAVFQVERRTYSELLAALETASGVKATRTVASR